MTVTLYTRDGGFVTRGEVPLFNEYPDVIFWGARTFVHERNGRYREAFAFALVTSAEAGSS